MMSTTFEIIAVSPDGEGQSTFPKLFFTKRAKALLAHKIAAHICLNQWQKKPNPFPLVLVDMTEREGLDFKLNPTISNIILSWIGFILEASHFISIFYGEWKKIIFNIIIRVFLDFVTLFKQDGE